MADLSPRRLSIGLVGVGRMGRNHLNTLVTLDECQLAGVVDPALDPSWLETNYAGVRLFPSLNQLLAHCDAIVLASPSSTHARLAVEVLQAGAHILVEKPLAIAFHEAESILQAAHLSQRICQVGHVERFNGAVEEVRQLLTQPVFIHAERLALGDRQDLGGVVLDLMIHDLDVVRILAKSCYPGQPLQLVSASGQVDHRGEVSMASALLESGSMAMSLVASRVSGIKRRILEVHEPNQLIQLDFSSQKIQILKETEGQRHTDPEVIRTAQVRALEERYVHRLDHPLRLELRHFIRCCLGEESPIVSPEEELETLSLALKIHHRIVAARGSG